MTQPRMCLAGTTYLVTRTCANRRYLFRPDPIVVEVWRYCLARALRGFNVEVHAISVESNQVHLVLTDFEGELSRFMQVLDRLVAVCLVEYYRETHPTEHLEGVWSKGHFGATALLNEAAVLNAVAYTLTNPVKDGLVPDYRKWPGFNSRPADWLKPVRTAERVELFFDQEDADWAEVPYRFTVPPMLRVRDPQEIVRDVERHVEREQNALRTKIAAEGRTFLGVKGVLAVDPLDSPDTVRPKGKLNPRLAAGGDSRLLHEGKKLLRAFRERYREAWRCYCCGEDAVFPAGTYLMKQRFGVACDTLTAPWCVAALNSC